jgi:hypothetical protein
MIIKRCLKFDLRISPNGMTKYHYSPKVHERVVALQVKNIEGDPTRDQPHRQYLMLTSFKCGVCEIITQSVPLVMFTKGDADISAIDEDGKRVIVRGACHIAPLILSSGTSLTLGLCGDGRATLVLVVERDESN